MEDHALVEVLVEDHFHIRRNGVLLSDLGQESVGEHNIPEVLGGFLEGE
jgi:hypothetical protein